MNAVLQDALALYHSLSLAWQVASWLIAALLGAVLGINVAIIVGDAKDRRRQRDPDWFRDLATPERQVRLRKMQSGLEAIQKSTRQRAS